jgi:hypothetical protein
MDGQKKAILSASARSLVKAVGKPVTPDEVDLHGRIQEIRDRSHWIRTVVTAWKCQQVEDRKMRKRYATCLMIIMAAQILVINVLYILMGCGKLQYEPWTAKTFIMSVFAEVAALVLLIVKYLFRSTNDKVLDLGYPLKPRRGKGHVNRL